MEALKSSIVPGVLAYVGMRAAAMVAPTSTTGQLIGALAGSIAGVFLSKKIG